MCDRNDDFLILRIINRKRSSVINNLKHRVMTAELHRHVAAQCARQETCFGQNLESVADAEHEFALLRRFGHFSHDRSEPGDGAAAQIVTIREAARNENAVIRRQVGRGMPHIIYRFTEAFFYRFIAVNVTIGARKDKYSKFHDF
ncbi:hypothetical protein D3C75_1102730 [compost metagenome]